MLKYQVEGFILKLKQVVHHGQESLLVDLLHTFYTVP